MFEQSRYFLSRLLGVVGSLPLELQKDGGHTFFTQQFTSDIRVELLWLKLLELGVRLKMPKACCSRPWAENTTTPFSSGT